MLEVGLRILRKMNRLERKALKDMPLQIARDYLIDKGMDDLDLQATLLCLWKPKQTQIVIRGRTKFNRAIYYFGMYSELNCIIFGDFAPTKNGLKYVKSSNLGHVRPYATGRSKRGYSWHRPEVFRFVKLAVPSEVI